MNDLVSIVIPAKDEAETLGSLLKDIRTVTASIKDHRFEVIVVDDHCVDATAQIAQEHGARVVKNLRRGGKGNALRAGFEAAQGSIFLMLDADGSHRPEELPHFLKPFERKEIGLVVGSRSTGGSEEYTIVRTFGNVGLSLLCRASFGMQLTDVLNGYKAFRREIFTDFKYTSQEFEIEIELVGKTLRRGFKIAEFPSHELERAGGEAKSRVVRHGFRFLWRIIYEGFFVRFAAHADRIFNIPCKLCKHPATHLLISKNGYDITACPECELAFVTEIPDEQKLEDHYGEGYFKGDIGKFGYADYALERRCRLMNFERKKSEIERTARSGRLLDVGCADGSFIGLFSAPWECTGIELSAEMAQEARKTGHSVIQGDLLQLPKDTPPFDVITMWDVIDHVRDPFEVLAKAYALLKPGGRLYLNVGDRSSLFARFSGTNWYIYIPPTHLFYFTPKSLEKTLQSVGFKAEDLYYTGKYATLALCFWRLRYVLPSKLTDWISGKVGSSRFASWKIYFNFFDLMTVVARKPQ